MNYLMIILRKYFLFSKQMLILEINCEKWMRKQYMKMILAKLAYVKSVNHACRQIKNFQQSLCTL